MKREIDKVLLRNDQNALSWKGCGLKIRGNFQMLAKEQSVDWKNES